MGSRIAAHFANAGVPALLLDIVLPGKPDRNAAARAGIEAASKQKPGGLFTPEAATLITPGNFEDHLKDIRGCDWVLEAVTERLEIKRELMAKVAIMRSPGSIISTNTSGIPLAAISEGFDSEFRQHFLGTHFFNPPRYLHLLEMIPGADTLPEVLAFVRDYCDRRLGKGVVPCKDTPNFIANRIGTFFAATLFRLTTEGNYTIEEVDALTGSLIGLPNSATFRLADLIGLDVWGHVLNNLRTLAPDDPGIDRYGVPEFMAKMIERGWLGEKRGQGFYKRVGPQKEIHAIDWKTLEYHVAQKPKFPSVEAARNIEDLPQRVRALVTAQDLAGQFLWKLFRDLFVYSATMIPEVSDRVVEIDRAMRWGYANKLGPFEMWDALGVRETVARMQKEGCPVPANVERMLDSGAESFYQAADSNGVPHTRYFDLGGCSYAQLEERPGVLVLSEIRRARGVVQKNPGASLVDLRDGVLCLEFHTKMNAIGDDIIQMIRAGIEETNRSFEALVIGNQGEHFSAGANLMMVLLAAQEG